MQGNKFDEPIVIDSDDGQSPPQEPPKESPPKEVSVEPAKELPKESSKEIPQSVDPPPSIIPPPINKKADAPKVTGISSILPMKRPFPKSKPAKTALEGPNQKKFKEAETTYRSFQPKEGKECRVGDMAQAIIPSMKELVEYRSSMTTVWNPWVISEVEGKLILHLVNDYLKAIANNWPDDICRFNEEIALQYLMQCSYYPKLALKINQESETPNQLRLLCESLF